MRRSTKSQGAGSTRSRNKERNSRLQVLNLPLERHAKPLPHRFGHRCSQLQNIFCRSASEIHDHVGVDAGNARGADASPFETALFEEPAGELTRRILEKTSSVGNTGRERAAALLQHTFHFSLDFRRISLAKAEGRGDDELARPLEVARSITMRNFAGGGDSRLAFRADELDGIENIEDFDSVGAGIHPYGPADRRRDSGEPLDSRQRTSLRLVGQRRERCSASRDDSCSIANDRFEFAFEKQNQSGETLVGDENVRSLAENEDRNFLPASGLENGNEGSALTDDREPSGWSADTKRGPGGERSVSLEANRRTQRNERFLELQFTEARFWMIDGRFSWSGRENFTFLKWPGDNTSLLDTNLASPLAFESEPVLEYLR